MRSRTLPPLSYAPPEQKPEVLFEDDTVLIANKPAGLLSVPGKAKEHHDCLAFRIQKATPEASIAHRLDMATSGVVLFAKNKQALRHLGLQFEKRQVKKTYIADIHGQPKADSGEVAARLICDWPNRPLQKICHKTGKEAITKWRVVKRNKDFCRVELCPLTGRSHQLRVHMQTLGHPILGDTFYANETLWPKSLVGYTRLHLHARDLSFRHPEGGKWVSFTAQTPF